MKRSTIRAISFSLSVVFVLGISAAKNKIENDRLMLTVQNSYSLMLNELCTAADNIALLLNKSQYVTTDKMATTIAAELLCEAEISKSSLAQLPVGGELTALNKFLSQVGNYAFSVAQNGESDFEKREYLSSISASVSKALKDARADFDNLEYWAAAINNRLEENEIGDLSTEFDELEDTFSDYPTFIYDGPYSDHIMEKEPELIKDSKTVSKKKALEIAAKWAECEQHELDFGGSTNSKAETYDFLGAGFTVSITKKGGLPLFLRRETPEGEIKLSDGECVERARAYLNKMGMNSFTVTYYFTADGVCTVNFAYKERNVICYTDLIKVGVSVTDGSIQLLEAGGYIWNHRERELPSPQSTISEAQQLISSGLKVKGCQTALIPTSGLNEVLCYEFSCTNKQEEEVLVYINTATLMEEEILILLKSDGGVLVK